MHMPRRTLRLLLATLTLSATAAAPAASLYWTEQTGGSISSPSTNTVQRGSTLGGGAVTGVYTSRPGGANGIEAIDGALYIPDQLAGTITRFDANGGNAVNLVSGFNPYDVDVDAGLLYWAEQNSDVIYRINADGSGSAEVAFATAKPVALDVVGSTVYYSEFGNRLLRRAGLDGSNAVTLVAGQEIRDLEVLGSLIYFVGYNPSTFATAIQRVNTDGSGLTTILGGLGFGNGIDVTADAIYFSDLFGAIARVDLNGSNQRTLYTGPFGGTRGVAVLDAAVVPLPGAAWLLLTALGGLRLRRGRH
jgi:hypothetical protein